MTRTAAPQQPPACLTIAGSDSGGGAGIQADLKAMEAAGVFGTSVLTAITAQHTRGVERSFVLPAEEIVAQLEAVRDDFELKAVKTGMLASAEIITTIRESLADAELPLVVDPVMVAASGDRLLDPAAEDTYSELIELATLVTPNADEAAVLVEHPVKDTQDAIDAGKGLVEMGAHAALVKGGHLSGTDITDVLVTPEMVREYRHPRVATEATHGSGCMLASTVAARLALGDEIQHAVETSLRVMDRAIRYPLDVGQGAGAVHHLAEIRNLAARGKTVESVRALVDALTTADVSELVPEVGMNVVGITPLGEDIADTGAVDGRITRTKQGIRANAGVAFEASSHVARFLLSVREHDPTIRFAINCRFNERIEEAIGQLGLAIAEYDRAAQPDAIRQEDGSTMRWAAGVICQDRAVAPDAVIDRGAHGKEPMLKLLSDDPETIRDHTVALADTIADSD